MVWWPQELTHTLTHLTISQRMTIPHSKPTSCTLWYHWVVEDKDYTVWCHQWRMILFGIGCLEPLGALVKDAMHSNCGMKTPWGLAHLGDYGWIVEKKEWSTCLCQYKKMFWYVWCFLELYWWSEQWALVMYKSGAGTVTVSDKTMSETRAGILDLPIRPSLIGSQTRLIVVLSMGYPAVTSLLIHLLINSLHSYP